jgi:hypothetical protein
MLRRLVWQKYTDISEVLAASITLMMETVSTSETYVNLYQATRRDIPNDSQLHIRCRENLKSHDLHLNDKLVGIKRLFYWEEAC